MRTYFPYRSNSGGQLVIMCLVIRTAGDPGSVMVRVRETLQNVDRSLAVLAENTIDQQLDDLLAQDRLLAGLVAIFGAASALLACLAAAVMMAVALTAACLPAPRAARVNPIVALREG